MPISDLLPSNRPLRVALAWGAHLFTASGAVWGFFALIAVFNHQWQAAIAWMILAILVDGLDGHLARAVDVKTYAPGIDGALLDNILDYLNYVLVPALFMIEAPDMLPPVWNWLTACAVLLSSAYQFTQVDAKTEDHFFKGFPSYWNVVVLYMLVLRLNPWINLAILLAFNVLVFVPIKYIYPSRTVIAHRLTVILSYLYGIIGVWGAMQYPNVPGWVVWVSFIYIAYYAVLSLWPRKKTDTPRDAAEVKPA